MQAPRGPVPRGWALTAPGGSALQVALEALQGAGEVPTETLTVQLAGHGPRLVQVLEHSNEGQNIAESGVRSEPTSGRFQLIFPELEEQ